MATFWSIAEIILKFVLTFVLATLFGIERQRSHKPLGFGSFSFVSIGACGLAIAAITFETQNPVPLLSAIVTGIGFLGAGAMIKTSDRILGVTTAAGIWLFAIVGLLIGIGLYFLALSIYALVWVVVLYDRHLEHHGIGSYQKKLVITANKMVNEKELETLLMIGTREHKKISVDINKKDNKLTVTYLIEGNKENINKIPKKLYEHDWIESIKIE